MQRDQSLLHSSVGGEELEGDHLDILSESLSYRQKHQGIAQKHPRVLSSTSQPEEQP